MVKLLLILEFIKAGLFSIGGGLATIPFLNQMAMRYPWFTIEELTDMIAISETTPGAIGINMSTYAGYQADGIIGAVLATMALILPSIVVIIIIANFLKRFEHSKMVQYGFYGVKASAGALILGAMVSVFQMTFMNIPSETFFGSLNRLNILLFFIFLLLIKKLRKVHPIAFIIIGAFVGIIFQL